MYGRTVKITAMAKDDFAIDYAGARGSNAGDEYHELWAVRHALRLLDEHTPLSAMTVEGLRAVVRGGLLEIRLFALADDPVFPDPPPSVIESADVAFMVDTRKPETASS